MTVKLVNDATAIVSMRESDFDAYSAMGEVIDNSIQADADMIKMRIAYGGGRDQIVTHVAFGDNGYGMNKDVLHRCMQLGYSTRYNDRNGIGRFGVGATLAAINQCQRVELYSKEKGSGWLYTYIDLEEIGCDPPVMGGIPEPIEKMPDPDFMELVDPDQGTLIIWTKYDRQPEPAGKMLEELGVWIGRTYRYFFWDGVDVSLNGKLIKAIDPLYLNTEKTNFPSDPPAQEFDPIIIKWPIPFDARTLTDNTQDEILVRMSLIDESFRPIRGSGGSPQARERYIDKNEGISILRNKREVFYGHIPYWKGKQWWENPDRWWGCEIHFDAILDRCFTVKNIKRGAVPEKSLKEAIYDKIAPTRNRCLEIVRGVWDQAEIQNREKQQEQSGVSTGHDEAERIAKETPTDKSALGSDKNFEEEADKLLDGLKRGVSDEKRAAWKAKWASQPFTIHDDSWKGPAFIDPVFMGGSDVIKYNNSHPLFAEINKIIQKLEGEDGDYSGALKLKSLIDLLLISYAKATSKFEGDITMTYEQFVESLNINWGQYLQTYLGTWLREDNE